MMNLLLTVKYNRIVIYQHLEMQTPPKKKLNPAFQISIVAKAIKHYSVASLVKINFHFVAVCVMQKLLKPTK